MSDNTNEANEAAAAETHRPWPDPVSGPYKIDLRTNMVEFSEAFEKVAAEQGVTKEAAKEQAALIKKYFPYIISVENGYDAITEHLALNAKSGWTKLSARAIGDKVLLADENEAAMAQLAS